MTRRSRPSESQFDLFAEASPAIAADFHSSPVADAAESHHNHSGEEMANGVTIDGIAKTRTSAQGRAIEHVHGPMLVVAGAGSGKTTVLVERIAHLIRTGTAQPNEILAITFTKNAAAHLRRKLAHELGSEAAAQSLNACNFDAFAWQVLERNERQIGLVDSNDLRVLLRMLVQKLPLKIFTKAANPGEFIDALVDIIKRCQDELRTAADYRAYVEALAV